MRVDTTVVETPIRYPSDSRLCEDVTQVVCREVERMRSAGVAAPAGFRNVRRSVGRRVRQIKQISRRPMAKDAKRGALRRPYRRLLAITRRVLRQAEHAVKRARRRWQRLSGRIRRSVRILERTLDLGRRVVTQTKQRVFHRVTKSKEKIVSIFEPLTRILRRGKVYKPTEFGQMVKVQEAEGGHRPWLLLDPECAARRSNGCELCRGPQAGIPLSRMARTRASTPIPSRAGVARRRRSANCSAQAHLWDASHPLSRCKRSRPMRLLGGDREQPHRDRTALRLSTDRPANAENAQVRPDPAAPTRWTGLGADQFCTAV